MQRTTSRRVFGFTLGEVIAIVAMLLIVGFVVWPVFYQKPPGTKSPCQNNLKHIALALKQYLNDFDERYPLVYAASRDEDVPTPGWATAIQPYLRKNRNPNAPNTPLLQCPGGGDKWRRVGNGYTDYWYNANFVIRRKAKSGAFVWTGANESMLGSSAQTILAADGALPGLSLMHGPNYNQCGDGSFLIAPQKLCRESSSAIAILPVADLHIDGVNFAFADGHVKWLRGNTSTQSAQVMNNGATQKSIGGKVTFSLLNK